MINKMAEVLDSFPLYPHEDDDKFEQVELLDGAASYLDQANQEELLEDRDVDLSEYEVKAGL